MNATSAESRPHAASRARPLADRVVEATPLVGLALAVLAFYCVEAWLRKTPWIFGDELEWTQISRSIEETGHAARRGDPIEFKSLYAYLIAPFWAIHSTAAAYDAIKYLNAVVMTLAAVPTYLLARMFMPKRAAIAVGLLAVCIPGMSYASSLVPEVLAYPWFALCSWLVVRALATRRPRDVAFALAASGVALLVRGQLVVVLAAFALAAFGLWVTGPRGRALRAGWSRGDTLGAVVLLAGAFFVFNRIVLDQSESWQVSTDHWKLRMLDLGLRAALAFTIGLGILPVIGGLASLRLPELRGQSAYRAFAAYLAASIVCVSLYTATKATYLSTKFATLTEERNMIYLAPLLLTGTAIVLRARRLDWRLVAGAAAFVAFIVVRKPLELGVPNFEAPGFAILSVANPELDWEYSTFRIGLVAVLALALLVLLARHVRFVAPLVVVLGLAWMLTGQIQATRGSIDLADRLLAGQPQPLDWIDRATGREPTAYLGQRIGDANPLWLTEFWNRSIRHVSSLDGTAPGPGPTYSPDVIAPDGTLAVRTLTPYVVADAGIALQAEEVARGKQLILYRVDGPLKLLEAKQQAYIDGWVPGWSSYTYFKPGQRGYLEVKLFRTGYKGDAPPARCRIVVGTVRIDKDRGLQIGRRLAVFRRVVRNGEEAPVLRIPVTRTPVRVELFVTPTFVLGVQDPRELGVQAGIRFVPAGQG